MRLLFVALAFWLLTSVAMADVIFPDDPFVPRRRPPMPPRNWPPATELPVAPPTAPEESWHPNVEDAPDDVPNDMRIAVVMVAGLALLIFGASRQLDRRTA